MWNNVEYLKYQSELETSEHLETTFSLRVYYQLLQPARQLAAYLDTILAISGSRRAGPTMLKGPGQNA